MSANEAVGISLSAPDFLLKPPPLIAMPYPLYSSTCNEIRSAPASFTSSSTFTMWR